MVHLECFVCERMRIGRPEKHGDRPAAPTQLCLLCDRNYCNDHKGNEDGVCEINHTTYYRNHPQFNDIYPDMAARNKAKKESNQGI